MWQNKPFELWAYSKAHLICESALVKQTEAWLNLMQSGAVSLWLWLIWHSNYFSPLSGFPRSLVHNVDWLRKAALKHSRCYFFPLIGTKYFRSRNLHGNSLSELPLCWSFLVAFFPAYMSASGSLALVRFGVKKYGDLLWCETEIYLSSPYLPLSCPGQGSCPGSCIGGNTHHQRFVHLRYYRYPS